jgi:hypothetical protein
MASAVEASTARASVEAASIEASGGMSVDTTAAVTEAATVGVDTTAEASVDEATAVEVVRRVEAVAEGIPEETVTGEPGVAVRTTCPVPAGIEVSCPRVLLCETDVGFAEILGAEAAPLVEVIGGLSLVFVEALRFGRFASERQLMTTLDVNGFDVGLKVGSGIDVGFAVEDTDGGAACVEGVEAVLEKLGLTVFQVDEDDVLLIELVDFDVGVALFKPDFGFRQIGGDHLNGAVVAETENDSRSEKNFGFSVRGGQILSSLEFGVAHRVGSDGTAFYRGLSFDVIESPWAGWVRCLPEGGCGQSRQGKHPG